MRTLLLIMTLLLTPALAQADYYYIGQWEWITDEQSGEEYWTAPYSTVRTGAIDLRNNTQAGRKGGTPEGYALFAYSEYVEHDKLTYLGDNLDQKPNAQARGAVQTKLGVTPNKNSIREIIYELLTDHADPSGENRWKPLRPGVDGHNKIYFGTEGKIKEAAIIPFVSPEWENIQLAIQHDYRQLLKHEPHYLVSKWLDYQEHKFSVSYTAFIPNDVEIKLASLPHETTITETWDGCSNSDSLNCDLTWTELFGDVDIVSNRAQFQTLNGSSGARAESDLSSDDHYAKADFTLVGSSVTDQENPGVFIRKDSSATLTYYHFRAFDASTEGYQIYKSVEGAFTELATAVTEALPANPVEIKLQADGSSIKGYSNETEKFSVTNMDITANLRTGIRAFQGGAAGKSEADNFEAADLAAGFTDLPDDGTRVFSDFYGSDIYIN